ncbi:hypothetical protein SLEP1_g31759 [Rubroshorea leprosula]|uniref:Uncharacterized protein n=1 Tax=Rubroshorea leprosula TaxID=152421 RepID=A0AAV5KAT6_9ROSI|nr:hypothetical protein SLEP1_g31759 [Rubroshorea leprosula]
MVTAMGLPKTDACKKVNIDWPLIGYDMLLPLPTYFSVCHSFKALQVPVLTSKPQEFGCCQLVEDDQLSM